MAIPRPKILTRITVPTGGWTWKIYVSSAGGGQYGHAITADLAAGDYFVSGDNQSDCFLYALTDTMQTAITDDGNADWDLMMDINSDHKVRIHFDDNTGGGISDNDVKIAWTEEDGGDIAKVLGFDYSTDDTDTDGNPTFTGDYHHAYGWYADEDGLLKSLVVEDITEFVGLQSVAISGKVRTQQLTADRYTNNLMLQFLSRAKTYSQNVGYTTAPVHPYERNEPLECWWIEARKGVEFRVYRDGYIATAKAADRGTSTAGAAGTLTDANKSWDTEPQTYKSRILHMDDFGGTNNITQNWYIASHTATVLTVANAHPSGLNINNDSDSYYLFDHPYQTYVVDLKNFTKYEPSEIPEIDRYDIEIPLLRYV